MPFKFVIAGCKYDFYEKIFEGRGKEMDIKMFEIFGACKLSEFNVFYN